MGLFLCVRVVQNMSVKVVVGAQWGDEGKGKVTDLLSEKADVVVRYQGGNNAGHTVVVGEETYKLHLIPSGVLHANTTCIMGCGTVIDPECFATEYQGLRERGIMCNNIFASGNAHVIMPYHRLLDELEETSRGAGSIGTTRRGIGPVYTDKTARKPLPVRMWDLLNKDDLRERVEGQLSQKNRIFRALYDAAPLKVDDVVDEVWPHAEVISGTICDTRALLLQKLAEGADVVMEGAQGTLLDLDYGTYPYVTSSHPVAGGACLGTGLGPTLIDSVVIIAKAYSTRVGAGPFPTELEDATGDLIRERGHEYGTTTGRPRRCGWLDGVALRTSARINGATDIALMLLDVMDAFEKIRICTAYEINGKQYNMLPSDNALFERAKPVYTEVDGWQTCCGNATTFSDLPTAARDYVRLIEEVAGTRISIISVGPGRRQTIDRGNL